MLGKKKLTQAQFISYAGVLSALSIVLIFIEVPYPLVPYLKLDFSEVVTLIAVSLNFGLAIVVALVKASLTFLIKPGAIMIGHVAMLVGSLSLIVGYSVASKKFSKIVSLIFASIVFCVVMGTSNYFFIDPFYMGTSYQELATSTFALPFGSDSSNHSYLMYNIVTYLPFNMAKMAVVSTAFYFISNRLEKEQ
ncbi:ECF transporter S component [Mollicutes bacterium LVI A0039]|nr:ECF transporter S component [Mollicutes bacterium LVI A0039]